MTSVIALAALQPRALHKDDAASIRKTLLRLRSPVQLIDLSVQRHCPTLPIQANHSAASCRSRMAHCVGFIGLGSMGLPMATNLARALAGGTLPHTDKTLYVYNRTKAKAEKLQEDKDLHVEVMDSPGKLLAKCSLVFLILADDNACQAVFDQMKDELQQLLPHGGLEHPDKVVVNHSTCYPTFSKKAPGMLADVLGSSGRVQYVAAPVFGRPDAAAAAKLLVCPAGPAEVLARLQPFLSAHGRVLPAGDEPFMANVLKLTGNFCIVSVIEMLGEAKTLLEKSGVGAGKLKELIDAFFPAPPIQGYAKRIVENDLTAGFTVRLALKDVRYMRQLAEEGEAPLPLADLAFQHLLSAKALGHGESDWGAIAAAVEAAAGLEIPPPNKT